MHTTSCTVTASPKLRMGNSTGWQHPEAWLGSVTSIQGNSRLNEEAARKMFAASFPFGYSWRPFCSGILPHAQCEHSRCESTSDACPTLHQMSSCVRARDKGLEHSLAKLQIIKPTCHSKRPNTSETLSSDVNPAGPRQSPWEGNFGSTFWILGPELIPPTPTRAPWRFSSLVFPFWS